MPKSCTQTLLLSNDGKSTKSPISTGMTFILVCSLRAANLIEAMIMREYAENHYTLEDEIA